MGQYFKEINDKWDSIQKGDLIILDMNQFSFVDFSYFEKRNLIGSIAIVKSKSPNSIFISHIGNLKEKEFGATILKGEALALKVIKRKDY